MQPILLHQIRLGGQHGHGAGEHRLHAIARTTEGDMVHLDAKGARQACHRQMPEPANTARGIGQLPWIGPGARDDIGDRPDARCGWRHQRGRRLRDQADSGELIRAIGRARHEAWLNGDRRHGGQQDRLPIRFGAHHFRCADGARGAANIANDHLRAHRLGKYRLDQAADNVRPATRRPGDDHLHLGRGRRAASP